MHTYLESIGFKEIKTRSETDKLIADTVLHFEKKHLYSDQDGRRMGEFSRDYAPGMGITVCGEFDEDGNYHPEYLFPYLKGSEISINEEMHFEKHAGKESYAGSCEDPRIGVTLIYYLLNMGEFMEKALRNPFPRKAPVRLTALAKEGSIILPIRKYSGWEEENKKRTEEHLQLISKAWDGDEEAIESLTMEEMDLNSMIDERIEKEDIFSIVDTTFAPYGVECDQYSVLGTILSCGKEKNLRSGEEVWKLRLEACDVTFDVCINAETLYGYPKEGYRFRGLIWLLGEVVFS